MLAQNSNIQAFTVTNNAVADLMTFADAEKKQKTLEGVTMFLKANRYQLFISHFLLFDLWTEFVISPLLLGWHLLTLGVVSVNL